MASFKTRKISTKNPLRNHQSLNTITPRRNQKSKFFRRFVGFLLILSSCLFVGILMAKVIGNIELGGNSEESRLFQKQNNETQEDTPKKANEPIIKNILIGGIGGDGHPGGNLTDSLMLASLNYTDKTATLLSIPRDIYVAYTKTRAAKINALYPIGKSQNEGVNLLAKKITEITGQNIDHYIIIDFSGFKKIVDALGGVEVDVPNTIYDRQYPDENWGYETFKLQKGLQVLDGKTALKFVRSRHSTSDFDRSSRQRLLIKAIKDKALSLGIITNPTKIGEIFSSVQSSLSTDLTVGDLVDIGMNFKDINNSNIVMYSYNDDCNYGACFPGSFLYQPSRSLFDDEWVLIPEGATRSRLSKYDAMRRYGNLIFTYPQLNNQEKSIYIITNSKNLSKAKRIRRGLEQLGFPIDHTHTIYQTGATLGKSRIVAGNEFDEKNILIQSLQFVEESIPVSFSEKNEFIEGSGSVIEIILGDDIKNYFDFTAPIEYLPIDTPLKNSQSAEKTSSGQTQTKTGSTTSASVSPKPSQEKNSQNEGNSQEIPKLPSESSESTQDSYLFTAGEWENF